MPEYDDPSTADGLDQGRLAAVALMVLGSLSALVALVWALGHFWDLSHREPEPARLTEYLQVVALLLASWGFAALLWGAAEILRQLIDARDQAAMGGNTPRPANTDPRGDKTMHLLSELVHLTREVRDINLLSDDERAARLRNESADLVQQLEQMVPTLLREHNLAEAHQRLQRARERFPGLPVWDQLAGQVEQARQKFETHDVDAATREVDELASLGAWDRALDTVRTLRQRHPNSEKVETLARRVAAARDQATSEERSKLMSQAQEATNRRDWEAALRIVESFIVRFQNSPETLELRQQLPTLRANAEIIRRQRMEGDIKELIRKHQFAEALEIANELVARYPDSPQAVALREQLPRLQQKATEAAAS